MGAQELRIPEDSITIGGLFRHIEEQTPYTVAYSHAFLDPAKKISMPSSSGNIHLKDALSFLFGEMPYSYTINGSHIIILSAETDRYDGSYPEERSLSEERQFTFKGTACDRQSKERLEYATVCLLDADERMLSIGITGETGEFRLQTSRAPRKIKISFIGYETLMKDINGINENLGTFLMETTEQQLDEIIVSGGSLQSKTDRRTCHITPQMREGTFNAAELLDKIPGIHYDKYTQNFDVGNQSDILLLLDGMQQSPVYIKHFPSRQIRAIEIIREPSGRFISEGYGVIINLITEERMKGYDVFVSDISVANVAGGNGKDRLAKEQPAAGISLAGQRLTVYASGLYNREKWNMPMKRELLYDGRRVPFADNPNDAYRSEIINSTVGMNCRVNGSHTLAFHADYAAGNTYSEYMYMTDRNVLTDISNRTLKNMARNLTTARIAAGRLSYRGKMNNRLRLNSDFSFNYYGNDMDSRYGTSVNDTMNYLDKNLYNEYKNHTLFNMEA
ncbi:MAG: carboxypeptidase-like regulatory domain-containing protein, partial [Tannerella sp.]|nr:carboxypeptidase-like regulatory domain-containing protein [Tannerella sp.]